MMKFPKLWNICFATNWRKVSWKNGSFPLLKNIFQSPLRFFIFPRVHWLWFFSVPSRNRKWIIRICFLKRFVVNAIFFPKLLEFSDMKAFESLYSKFIVSCPQLITIYQKAEGDMLEEKVGKFHRMRIFACKFHQSYPGLFITGGWDDTVRVTVPLRS